MQHINIKWHQLLPLYIIIFIGYFGFALTVALYIPLLSNPLIFSSLHHASANMHNIVVGFLLAMYPIGQFIGSPIIGGLADQHGEKKVLMISIILCIIGFSLIGLSIDIKSLSLLFFSSFLTGLCESNMAIAQSIISKNTHNDKLKAKLIGYAFSACSLGYISGPLIAGITSTISLSFSFYTTSCGLLVLLFLIPFIYIPTSQATTKKAIIQSLIAFKTLFTDRNLRLFYFINFLLFLGIQGEYRLVPLYVQNVWHPSVHTFTLLITYASFFCFIANIIFLKPLLKLFSLNKLLITLLIVTILFTISILIPKQFHWIWLTYGITVIPTVILITVATTNLSNKASKHKQGQVLGNNQALMVLAEALSIAIGGYLASIHFSLPIIVIIILFIFTILLILSTTKGKTL